jgi:hypothetical protein
VIKCPEKIISKEKIREEILKDFLWIFANDVHTLTNNESIYFI